MRMKLVAACVLALTGAAKADTYQMQFTAINFYNVADFSHGAPADPLSGSIVYTADTPGGIMTAIDSIELSIGSHTYSLAEVGYLYVSSNMGEVGGLLHEPNWIFPDTDDFWLNYYSDTLTGANLYYNVAAQQRQWASYQFSDFSITPLQTPLPATLPLFATGLGIFYAALRCRKKILRRRLSSGTSSGG